MKQVLEILWYDVKRWQANRETFQLQDVSTKDYDPQKHNRVIFENPPNIHQIDLKLLPNEVVPIKCWVYCSAENEEEKKELSEMGKL